MKLTVHLGRPGIGTFDGLIKEKYLGPGGYEILEPREDLGFPLRAYVQRVKESTPKWLTFLRTYFDIEDIRNSFASFTLLAEHRGRVFALTFGQGFHTIERSRFEPNFGLRVTANAIDDGAVKTIDTRNLDTVTRQQRTQLSVGSDLSTFALDLDQEWVRKISGKCTDLEFARSLSGADAVTLNLELDLESLPSLLDRLLDWHGRSDYRERFGFIDNYRALRKDEPAIKRLEGALATKIARREHERISLAFPEIVDDDDISYVRVYSKRRGFDLNDLALDAIYAVLDESPVPEPLHQMYIVPINDDEEAVGTRRRLHDYVVCELDVDGKTYVLSLGSWFEVDRDYVRTVNEEVKRLADLTAVLKLPVWSKALDEGTYNKNTAELRSWAKLDKNDYRIGGPNQKVEICDLLTPDKHMVCVKKLTKSATLSHLFSQGSVSAQLYNGEEAYCARVENAVPAGGTADNPTPTIVYAIGTDRPGALAEELFFFSKVNLLGHAKTVRQCGLKVAIAKITMV